MTRSARQRPALASLTLVLLLLGLPGRCGAIVLVRNVSREEAAQIGIAVRTRPAADNDVRVQVEFRTAGPLQGFKYADLELTRDGKRLVTAPLMPRKPAGDSAPESTQLEFYVDPAALAGSTVTIVVYNEPLTGTGYRLQMKDFLPPPASP